MSALPFITGPDQVARFEVPPYRGRHYAQLVPDTLDIQERAALAVNGLTGPTDPDRDYLLYFRANFEANPPVMTHDDSDVCQLKLMEALPLMRLISGSDLNSQVDPIWMTTALRMVGPDGLMYWPSLPWADRPIWCTPGPGGAEQYAGPWFIGRGLAAISVYLLRDQQGPWRQEGEKIVRALTRLAIRKDDFAYFPRGGFTPDGPRPQKAEVPSGFWSSLAGWTTQGLAHFYAATGYEPARELAAGLSRYIRLHGGYFGPNGEFLPNGQRTAPGEPEPSYVHFQHHVQPLLGMLDLALSLGDRELAEFVRASFEWARNKGDVTVGYFPENVDCDEYMTSELCEVAAMIGLALKLSRAGLGDYWDDADRWTRNQFAEGQLQRADWTYRVHRAGPNHAGSWVPPSAFDPSFQTTDHVPERNLGAFAGWPSANDWLGGQGEGIMHCCTGNAARSLYFIWEHILEFEDQSLKVNLLLNRSSKWADIHSHIPYEGQVDVHMKEACNLRVRIPEWVSPIETACRIDGDSRPLITDGRYAVVGPVAAGQVVQITFPIRERLTELEIEKHRYVLNIKGNDVVAIDPPGRFFPLYQRDHYRENAVRWRKSTRFISEEAINW